MRADERFRSTPRLMRWAAERYGDAEAVVDGSIRWSFRELEAAMFRAARSFVALGVDPGDRVAIWAPNIHEWIATLLGLQAAGAALVPINTRFKGIEAGYVLAKSRARVLAAVNGFLGNDYVDLLRGEKGGAEADRPVAELESLAAVAILRGDPPGGTLSWDAFLAAGADVPDAEVAARIEAIGPGDLSDIMFTSGTTGMPKGVMCTHGQTLRVYTETAEITGFRPGERYLIVNPFFHSFGYKAGIISAIYSGATIVPMAVFDAGKVLQMIEAERITRLPGPPALFLSMLSHPELKSFDLSSLRAGATGAAVIPDGLVRRMREELGYREVTTGYGLTEATAFVSTCTPDDDDETVETTSGRPIAGIEVQVVDEDGRELPRGTPGEIWVRGFNVMSGYFEDPEATARAIDREGWLHTGDIGVMNERGYLRVTDRKTDMFIVGGFNAYPAEIESLLLQNPAIAQVAVIGVPDARLGEVGCAFVVLRPDASATPDELHAWSRDHMANYKVPRSFELVDELPLNASGKVLKHVLRERAAAGAPPG